MCFYPVCLILTAAISGRDASLAGAAWPSRSVAPLEEGEARGKGGAVPAPPTTLIIKDEAVAWRPPPAPRAASSPRPAYSRLVGLSGPRWFFQRYVAGQRRPPRNTR